MDTDTKRIIEDLASIKTELDEIKNNMPDKEMFLTTEEARLLEESYENQKKCRLTPAKELRKKLGV